MRKRSCSFSMSLKVWITIRLSFWFDLLQRDSHSSFSQDKSSTSMHSASLCFCAGVLLVWKNFSMSNFGSWIEASIGVEKQKCFHGVQHRTNYFVCRVFHPKEQFGNKNHPNVRTCHFSVFLDFIHQTIWLWIFIVFGFSMNKEDEVSNNNENNETDKFVSVDTNQDQSHKRPSSSHSNSQDSKKTKREEAVSPSSEQLSTSEHLTPLVFFWLDPRKEKNSNVKKDISYHDMENLQLCYCPSQFVKSDYLHPYPSVLFPSNIDPESITLEICEYHLEQDTFRIVRSVASFCGPTVVRWLRTQAGFVAVAYLARLEKKHKIYARDNYFLCFTGKYLTPTQNPAVDLTSRAIPVKIVSRKSKSAKQEVKPVVPTGMWMLVSFLSHSSFQKNVPRWWPNFCTSYARKEFFSNSQLKWRRIHDSIWCTSC